MVGGSQCSHRRSLCGRQGRSVSGVAKELVALQPDVIFADSTPIVAALQRESRTIPIVFVSVSDPIGSGFVASLARPGGSLSPVTSHNALFPSYKTAPDGAYYEDEAVIKNDLHFEATARWGTWGQKSPFNNQFRNIYAHWFMSLDDARRKCEAWRRDHNKEGASQRDRHNRSS
jgi:hypothetical protein